MPKRRRLEDLYILGREASIDDGRGDPVVVWLQKLNPLDHEKAWRKAGAVKAQALMARGKPDSEEWQEAYSEVDDLGSREALVDYLISEDVAKAQEATEAELSFADEWANDGYLQGLRDAWEDEERPLRDDYARDPEAPEARRVFEELKRFSSQVSERVDAEAERFRRDYEDVPDEDLRRKATDRYIEMRAGLVWVREYRRCEIWLATREPDHHDVLYFPAREAVDRVAPEVLKALIDTYQALTVEPAEGKGSRRTPSSSPSSEPADVVETSVVSGLAALSL